MQLALLSTLCFVGRLLFASLPNIQPLTALLLIFTITLGLADSLMIMVLTMILSNLILGMGPWTVLQVVSYTIILIIMYLCHRFTQHWLKHFNHFQFILYTAISGISGLLYGFIISILWTALYQINHFWAYYLRGVSFDVAHAVGNIVFFILLYGPIIAVLKRANMV